MERELEELLRQILFNQHAMEMFFINAELQRIGEITADDYKKYLNYSLALEVNWMRAFVGKKEDGECPGQSNS